MSKNLLYKVRFLNESKVYEIYAKQVYQGTMYGFIVVEDIVFGETSSVVIDPSEEKLRSEFEGVKETYLPMHSILRIDQVEKQGTAKISDASDNVTAFPSPIYTPKGNSTPSE
ncbi:MAG: DUF1820 family protein [Pseudomonadota bacterium]